MTLVRPLVRPIRDSLQRPSLGVPGKWSPFDVGSKLIAWWDASHGLELTGTAVDAWADKKGGLRIPRTGGDTSPTYLPTGYNGKPALSFDGIANRLMVTPVPAQIPINADGLIAHFVVDQTALAADTTSRYPLSYGGGAAATSRFFRRVVVTAANRWETVVGNGTTSVTTRAAGLIDGKQLVTAKHTSVDASASLGAGAYTTAAVVPATPNTTGFAIGALHSSALGYWQGLIRDIAIFSNTLTAAEETKARDYFLARVTA